MIDIRLFGDLRRYAGEVRAPSGVAVQLPAAEGRTVGDVLARMNIDLAEVGNIFLNGRLLPRSTYPIILGYPLVAQAPLSSEAYLNTPVHEGDRLGIFPRNMSAVVV